MMRTQACAFVLRRCGDRSLCEEVLVARMLSRRGAAAVKTAKVKSELTNLPRLPRSFQKAARDP
jgi:hypothetical protein